MTNFTKSAKNQFHSNSKHKIHIPHALIRWQGLTKAAIISEIEWFTCWKKEEDPEGWFFRTNDEWMTVLGLSSSQVTRVTRALEKDGLIETKTKKIGKTPKKHYRTSETFYECFGKHLKSAEGADTSILRQSQNATVAKCAVATQQNAGVLEPSKMLGSSYIQGTNKEQDKEKDSERVCVDLVGESVLPAVPPTGKVETSQKKDPAPQPPSPALPKFSDHVESGRQPRSDAAKVQDRYNRVPSGLLPWWERLGKVKPEFKGFALVAWWPGHFRNKGDALFGDCFATLLSVSQSESKHGERALTELWELWGKFEAHNAEESKPARYQFVSFSSKRLERHQVWEAPSNRSLIEALEAQQQPVEIQAFNDRTNTVKATQNDQRVEYGYINKTWKKRTA